MGQAFFTFHLAALEDGRAAVCSDYPAINRWVREFTAGTMARNRPVRASPSLPACE